MGEDRLGLLSRLWATANFNTALAVACILFSVFLFVVIPYQVEKPPILFGQSAGVIDPALFPRLVAGAFMLVGIWYLKLSFDLREANGFHALDQRAWVNVAVTIAVSLVYAALLKPLGFIISSTLVTAMLALFYGARSWPIILAVAIGVPIGAHYVFTRWLAVALPQAPWQ